MSYKVSLEQFAGPLDLLLELIHDAKLDINNISLTKVTEDFLYYLQAVEEKRPNEMADFLIVATKLLYLKSVKLLPEIATEEDDGFDLATQLRIYKDFALAAKKIEVLWKADVQIFMRDKPYALLASPSFGASASLTASALRGAFAVVLDRLGSQVRLEEHEVKKIVTLAEKMRSLQSLLAERSSFAFHECLERGNRADVVVGFIALLELIKQRVVEVTQEDAFCDILVKKV